MNNIFKKSLKSGAIGLMGLLALSACTDDHFDVFGGDGTSNQTIWQNIEQHSELTQLEAILKRAYMMRSETDKIVPGTTKTLAMLLNEPQSFTVWAPLDGTYDADHYIQLLDSAEQILAENGGNVTKDYLRLEYEVANQFVYNHVARFNYEGAVAGQEVILLNGKKINYKSDSNIFNGVNIQGNPVISSNGTMHLLEGNSPFAYNIYDFISANKNLSKLSGYLLDSLIDKYTFSEGLSIEGALNENGDMVYVDSGFIHTNEILNRCGASLSNEDSTYIAILPTDQAWDGASERLQSYFKYKKTICYDWNTSTGRFSNTGSNAYKLNADSLQDYNVKVAMIQSAFFSPSTWHGISENKDSAEVVDYALTADSLISTNFVCYYNSKPGEVNPMFNGQTPEKASNGYIFCVDDYSVQPEYVWMRRNEIDATSIYNMAQPAATSSHCTMQNGTTMYLNIDTRDSIVVDPYNMSSYQRFQRDGRNTMTVDFRLNSLLSGKYTIKAIMAPSRINYNVVPDSTVTEISTFYAEILDDEAKAIEILEGNNGTSAKNKTRTIDFTVDQDSVKEYVIVPCVEIPYCFYNLPTGINTFYRLRLSSTYDRKKTTEGDGLNIYKIIIEPYREGNN